MTQSRLKKLLHYDEKTGVFKRRTKASCRTNIGDIAGGYDAGGYLYIRVDGKRMKAHRLAFLYMTGSMPVEVDHINHDKKDNSWSNLRSATRTEQNRNHTRRIDNTSDKTGVTFSKREKKYRARISHEKKRISLGTFNTKDEAIKAREKAEIKYGYHKNHGEKI